MRWRHFGFANAISDTLSSFWNFYAEDSWNIQRINRWSVDLKTAAFNDSETVSSVYLFIHCAFINSFSHTCIHTCIYTAFLHAFILSFTHAFLHAFSHAFLHAFLHAFNMHSYMNSPFIHATFICSFTRHSFILLYSSLLQKERWFSRVPFYTLVFLVIMYLFSYV